MKVTSEGPFPYGYPGRVCYIEQDPSGELTQIMGREGIRSSVKRAQAGECKILAAWPGQFRTDLFLVDDLDQLALAVHA